MNNIIIDGYNKKIGDRTIYAREYYLKNKYKKRTYYKKYYNINKNNILMGRQSRKPKLPTNYNKIRADVILSFK